HVLSFFFFLAHPPPPDTYTLSLHDALPISDQFRNLRCTSQELQLTLSGCSSGFPTITPNPQYALRSAGVVGQRLHVDVDFDSQREFDANNNIHVWYEGLEDEFLRRVEAGNVTFQAPPSRFITAAIPANNFGVQAIAQAGPLELRAILAQQKGNVVKDRFYSVGDVTSQPLDREARDLDYEAGRFFFVIDPAALPGYPAVDILQLDQLPRPDSLTVGALRVYRRRAIAPTSNGNQNVGGVRAVACGPGLRAVDCSAQREGPFEWEVLQEGKDYYVDPTGAWFALANRLDQSDYLAVSYVTASGTDSIGTIPVDASRDTAKVDTLRLVYDPKPAVNAASPTFRFQTRSAYRVSGRAHPPRVSHFAGAAVGLRAAPPRRGDRLRRPVDPVAQQFPDSRGQRAHLRGQPIAHPGTGLHDRLHDGAAAIQEPRCVVPGRRLAGARAVRGASRVRACADDHVRTVGALRPRRHGAGEPARHLPERAKHVHPAAARIRTVV